MTGFNFDTTIHLFQHVRVVVMDVTAPRTVLSIRTVRVVTSYVIVPRINSVIRWWAVWILLPRHVLLEQRLHDKVQTTLQTTSAAVLRTTLVIIWTSFQSIGFNFIKTKTPNWAHYFGMKFMQVLLIYNFLLLHGHFFTFIFLDIFFL